MKTPPEIKPGMKVRVMATDEMVRRKMDNLQGRVAFVSHYGGPPEAMVVFSRFLSCTLPVSVLMPYENGA